MTRNSINLSIGRGARHELLTHAVTDAYAKRVNGEVKDKIFRLFNVIIKRTWLSGFAGLADQLEFGRLE